MKIYTGIGSRSTPGFVLATMTDIAVHLAKLGYTLRSGYADGADQAFEVGATHKEIFLPWLGFNGSIFTELSGHYVPNFYPELMAMAAQFHPNWGACKPTVRNLMARNVCQVLGRDMDQPSEFVVCWTPGGLAGGGTGQAIRIAQAHNIPVFDLGSENGEERLVDHLNRQVNHASGNQHSS